MKTLRYKNYQGVVEFDKEIKLFHGEEIGLKDVIAFQGKIVAEVTKAFQESIEDYFDFCFSCGEKPEEVK